MQAKRARRSVNVRRILVPVDGSDASLRALRYACAHYRGGRTDIVVLNVQSPLPPGRYSTRAMIEEYYRQMAAEARERAFASLGPDARRVKWESRIGSPATTIARFAAANSVAGIVMGTRGLGRMAGFFLGSTAMQVIHHSSIPVTLVK